MKNIILASLFILSFIGIASGQKVVEQYLEKYQGIAIREMERTGIPASIKLAQGLLESDCGRSDLAREGKNHFGIKCGKAWSGKTFYKEDDDRDASGRLKPSCFRVFPDASSSYVAHSEFLLNNERYAFLFDYDPSDYKSWAKGLRKAGYATDRKYPAKLIGVIRKYDLERFDDMQSADLAQSDVSEQDAAAAFMRESIEDIEETNKANRAKRKAKQKKKRGFWARITQGEDFTRNNSAKKEKSDNTDDKKNTSEKNTGIKSTLSSMMDEFIALGEDILGKDNSENDIKTRKEVQKEQRNDSDKKASPPATTKKKNKSSAEQFTKSALSERGETLADVALRLDIAISDIVQFNDGYFKLKKVIPEASKVFIEAKPKEYPGNKRTHQVAKNEKLVEIAHLYGIQLEALRKRNLVTQTEEVQAGEKIYLKGKRPIGKPKTRKQEKSSKEK